jgi:hypothetical protein
MRIGIYLLLAFLSACATQQQAHTLNAPWNKQMAIEMLAPGMGVVKGSALIRQRGGGVVTCAGNRVMLVPATGYATERIRVIYGNDDRGFFSAKYKMMTFSPDAPDYYQLVKETRCDSQGFFRFDSVADGEFFIITDVKWKVNDYFFEGGSLMHKARIQSGNTVEIVLSP